MIKSSNVPVLAAEEVSQIKGKNKTITNGYADIDALVCKCWQKGCSFRLLATILRTKRYGTVYGVLIRSKAFVCCAQSRPSRDEKEIIAEIPLNIIEAMEKRNITVRKWCRAYGFQIADLWYRQFPNPEEALILPFLQEDFPEIFDIDQQEYKSAPIGCDRKSFFGGKKGRHIIWSDYYGIRVQHIRENEAIKIFNWRKSQIVMKRRLKIYLDKGIEAALAWPPSELIGASERGRSMQKRVLSLEPEEEARQKKIYDVMKRQSEIDSLIRKIAALPRPQYQTPVMTAQELQMLRVLVEVYGVPSDQINNSVKYIRQKAGRN